MTSNNALIGFTGFVGTSLLKQNHFECQYRSTNITDICNQSFDLVVCAGAPGVKWLANKHPEQDKAALDTLITNLASVTCKTFVLISTVDVFKESNGVAESTPIDTENLQPYGLHRYQLEEFVKNTFNNYLIVRLPGLIGPGLKKNVIFDFLNNNNLEAIDSRGVFQFYPMVNLWADIQIALENKCSLIHLTSEPLPVHEIATQCFNMEFNQQTVATPAIYDFKTEFAHIFGTQQDYQYSQKEIISTIRYFAQSEPKKVHDQ